MLQRIRKLAWWSCLALLGNIALADQSHRLNVSAIVPPQPCQYPDICEPVQANVAKHLAPDGSWFVNIKEHCDDGQRSLYVKDLTLAHVRKWEWAFIDEFAWTKSGVPGKWPNRFKNAWEPVFHFAKAAGIRFNPEAVGHDSKYATKYSAATEFGNDKAGYSEAPKMVWQW